ncbi:MAG: peroxiredoxin-like family protein [Planctomycetota bacterium]
MDRAIALAASICIAGALAGCGEPDADVSSNTAENTTENSVPNQAQPSTASNDTSPATAEAGSLKETLSVKKASFAAAADDNTKRIYAEGIQSVADAGVLAAAVNTGDTAPAFTLPDAQGNPVSLASLLGDGHVVMVWYRGGWCPYCNLTLRAYQEVLPQIKEAGGTLVAVSPELPDNALTTKEKNELDFVVLTDENNRVARDFGVVFSLTGAVHDNYNKNFDFDTWNGQPSGELPLAATYVIDASGVVRYAFLDADYRERAEPSEVLAALQAID